MVILKEQEVVNSYWGKTLTQMWFVYLKALTGQKDSQEGRDNDVLIVGQWLVWHKRNTTKVCLHKYSPPGENFPILKYQVDLHVTCNLLYALGLRCTLSFLVIWPKFWNQQKYDLINVM